MGASFSSCECPLDPHCSATLPGELAQYNFSDVFDSDTRSCHYAQDPAPKPVGLDELFGDGSTDLCDSAVYLADFEAGRLASSLEQRLKTELDCQSHCDDGFLDILTRRLCLYTRIYHAVDGARERDHSPCTIPPSSTFTSFYRERRPKALSQLGIQILYTVLTYISEDNETRRQIRKLCLSYVSSLLGDLRPNCLLERVRPAFRASFDTSADVVINSTRQILMQFMISGTSKCQKLAASSLIRLASARGNASNLLCIVQRSINYFTDKPLAGVRKEPFLLGISHKNVSHHKSQQLRILPLKSVHPKDNSIHHFAAMMWTSTWAFVRHLYVTEDDHLRICPGENQNRIWSCGENFCGELLHGDNVMRTAFTEVKHFRTANLSEIAAGNEYTAVLTRSGQAYCCGNNDSGQCGQVTCCSGIANITSLLGHSVVQIAAYNGSEHILVVLKDGHLISFGLNHRGQLGHGNSTLQSAPRIIRGLDAKRVSKLACSYYHSIVAVWEMQVYTFGRNDFGQLGHGDLLDKLKPCSVPQLRGLSMESVACGEYHTCVADTLGLILSCGKNDYGQLGCDYIGACEKSMKPVLTDWPGDWRARQICCGCHHTIGLMSQGRVLAFGRNDYGQLGLGYASLRVYGPRRLGSLDDKLIASCVAGAHHTVFVEICGLLYVCGLNDHGQLGTEDKAERHLPFLLPRFRDFRVTKAAAGFHHTLVLTSNVAESITSDCRSSSSRVTPIWPRFLLSVETGVSFQLDKTQLATAVDAAAASFIFSNVDRLIGIHRPTHRSKIGGATFELMLSLLDALVQEVLQADPPTTNSAKEEITLENELLRQHYLIILLLRILRRSVVSFRQSEDNRRGGCAHTAKFGWLRPSKNRGRTRSMAAERLQEELGVVAFDLENQVGVCDLLDSFETLLSQLVCQSFLTGTLTSSIQREAVSILLCGFDVFYPSRTQQIVCLADALKCYQQREIRKTCSTTGTCHFAERLMKKAATESYICRLVPSHNVAFTGKVNGTLAKLVTLLMEGVMAFQMCALSRNVLLALQKQVMILATTAERARTLETRLSLVIDSSYCHYFSLCNESLIEAASKQHVIRQEKITPCMQCLLDYSLHLIRLHQDFFTRPGSLIDNCRGGACDSVTVLLSLLTGIVHFSSHSALADKLVWPVANLLCLVDTVLHRANSRCTPEADHSSELLDPPRACETDSILGDLMKTMVVLSSSLAANLVKQRCTSSANSFWLKSDLMRFGLDSSHVCALARDGLVPAGLNRIIPAGNSSGNVDVQKPKSHYTAKLDYLQKEKLNALFDSLLRSNLCAADRTYCCVLNQVKSSRDSEYVLIIEHLVAKSLLKYNNLTEQAEYYSYIAFGKVTSGTRFMCVPQRFRAIWTIVAQLTTWMWQTRSKVKSTPQSSERFFSSVVLAVQSLSMFQSDGSSSLSLSHVPPSLKHQQGRPPNLNLLPARVLWHRAKIKVRALVRWRRTYAIKSTSCTPLMRSRKYPLTCKSLLLGFIMHFAHSGSKPVVNLLSSLLTNVAANYQVNAMRVKGIETYHSLFDSLTSKSLTGILASNLNRNLSRSTADDFFFFCEDAIDNTQTSQIHHASEKLFAGFATHVKVCNSYLSENTMISKTAAITTAAARILLMVFSFWAKYTHECWYVLVNEALVQQVNSIFVTLYGVLASDATNETHFAGHKTSISTHALCDKGILRRCLCASWTLIRQFGVTATSASVFCSLPKDVNLVLHDAARRVLVQSKFAQCRIASRNSLASLDPVQGRRCKELISAPLRFLSTEVGVLFSLDGLPYSGVSDFSITCWFFLTQDFTGQYRFFFARHIDKDALPIVLLRDVDSRIEVGGLHGTSGTFRTMLISKEPLQLNVWTHIGLVFEGNKIRLYINGCLDNQVSSNFDTRPSRCEVFVGKLPEDGYSIRGVHGGIEGSLAIFKYYFRALSPIHVRVLYDQGAPEAMFVCHDRVCNQLCSSIYVMVSFPQLRFYFMRWTWLNLFFNYFLFGSTRVQQAVFRIWRLLLPNTTSRLCLASFGPRHDWFGESVNYATIRHKLGTTADDDVFLDYMLVVGGFSMFRRSHSTSGVRKSIGVMIPQNLTVCYEDTGMKCTVDASTLASEVVLLVQSFIGSQKWRRHTLRRLAESIIRARSCIEEPCSEKTPMLWAKCLAGLSVLGGHLTDMHQGCVVHLRDIGIEAIVIECNESMSSASVIASKAMGEFTCLETDRPKVQLSCPKHMTHSTLDDRRVVHLNTKGIFVLHDMPMDWSALTVHSDSFLARVLIPCLVGLLRSTISSLTRASLMHGTSCVHHYPSISLCSGATKALLILTSRARLCNLIPCDRLLLQTLLHSALARSIPTSLLPKAMEDQSLALRRLVAEQNSLFINRRYEADSADNADIRSSLRMAADNSRNHHAPPLSSRYSRSCNAMSLLAPFSRREQGRFGKVCNNDSSEPIPVDDTIDVGLDCAGLLEKSYQNEFVTIVSHAGRIFFKLLHQHATQSVSTNECSAPNVTLFATSFLSIHARHLSCCVQSEVMGNIILANFQILPTPFSSPGPNIELSKLMYTYSTRAIETGTLLGSSALAQRLSNIHESCRMLCGRRLLALLLRLRIIAGYNGVLFMRLCNCTRSTNTSSKIILFEFLTAMLAVWQVTSNSPEIKTSLPPRVFWFKLFCEDSFTSHLRLRLQKRILVEVDRTDYHFPISC